MKLKLTDAQLLNELQRLVVDRGVMLRSCRSGVKINLGFDGYTAMYEFFGGPELGAITKGVGNYSDWYVEAGPHSYGTDIRSLLTKAIMSDRETKSG